MKCPFCDELEDKVVDSRMAKEGEVIRRRRECLECGKRFTTYERFEEGPLVVAKSRGGREPFDRMKIVVGVAAACKGRPVTEAQVEALVDQVEDAMRAVGPEVPSSAVGLEVLDRLRDLDEVAYLRFASVYKDFDAADDFRRELVLLQKLQICLFVSK